MFSLPGTPVEALSRPPGLCRIYLFTWELSSERGAEGISVLSGGPSHSSLKAETSRKVGRRGSEGRLGWSCALCGILLYSGLSQRRVWGSRAADCLAASPWGQPSLLDEIGRNVMRRMSEALTGPESKAVAVPSESETTSPSDISNHTPVSLSPPAGASARTRPSLWPCVIPVTPGRRSSASEEQR